LGLGFRIGLKNNKKSLCFLRLCVRQIWCEGGGFLNNKNSLRSLRLCGEKFPLTFPEKAFIIKRNEY